MKKLFTLVIAGFALSPHAAVFYVNVSNAAPASPFSDWTTAATNIQDAVDAASARDSIVVTNGVYQTGGRVVYGALTNRLAVTKPLLVSSVNGSAVTVIQGYQVPGTINDDGAARCVYLTNGAALVGFTLTNGATRSAGDMYREQSGGGVWCETNAVVSNCIVTANAAANCGGGAFRGTLDNCPLVSNFASIGGGAYEATLTNCTLAGNSATGPERGVGGAGGGAYQCTLNNCVLAGNSAIGYNSVGGGVCGGRLTNCTLTGNSAFFGGGAYYSASCNCTLTGNLSQQGGGASGGVLNNCTLLGNSGANSGGVRFGTLNNCIVYFNIGGNYYNSTLNYCCTTPLPDGVGNFNGEPLFVDSSGGNLRLQSNSPCINAGLNSYVSSATDLDGNPRIVGGTVDIGAYEYQTPSSIISYAWMQQYNLPTDGSADSTDFDGDGMTNWQEWRTGTNPTNALSVLKMLAPSNSAPGVSLTWQSVSGVGYYLQCSTNLPAFLTLQSNIVGQAGTTSFTDTNAVGAGPFYYRVGVQ